MAHREDRRCRDRGVAVERSLEQGDPPFVGNSPDGERCSATHFWMFVEQNGNPGAFLEECKTTAPNTRTVLTKPGEAFLFEKTK